MEHQIRRKWNRAELHTGGLDNNTKLKNSDKHIGIKTGIWQRKAHTHTRRRKNGIQNQEISL